MNKFLLRCLSVFLVLPSVLHATSEVYTTDDGVIVRKSEKITELSVTGEFAIVTRSEQRSWIDNDNRRDSLGMDCFVARIQAPHIDSFTIIDTLPILLYTAFSFVFCDTDKVAYLEVDAPGENPFDEITDSRLMVRKFTEPKYTIVLVESPADDPEYCASRFAFGALFHFEDSIFLHTLRGIVGKLNGAGRFDTVDSLPGYVPHSSSISHDRGHMYAVLDPAIRDSTAISKSHLVSYNLTTHRKDTLVICDSMIATPQSISLDSGVFFVKQPRNWHVDVSYRDTVKYHTTYGGAQYLDLGVGNIWHVDTAGKQEQITFYEFPYRAKRLQMIPDMLVIWVQDMRDLSGGTESIELVPID